MSEFMLQLIVQCMNKLMTHWVSEKTQSWPFGEGTAEISSSTGLGIAEVPSSGNHESTVGSLVTHVEENFSCYLTAEKDKKCKATLV